MVAVAGGEYAGLAEHNVGGGVAAARRRSHSKRTEVSQHAMVGDVGHEEIVAGVECDALWIAQGGGARRDATLRGRSGQPEYRGGRSAHARKSAAACNERRGEFQ